MIDLGVHLVHRRLAGDLAFDVEKANPSLFCAIPIPSLFRRSQSTLQGVLPLMQRKNMVPGGFDIGGGGIWLGKTVA